MQSVIRTVTLALAAVLPLAPVLAAQPTDAGEGSGVRVLTEAFAAAWGRHNARELAALWTEDGDLVNPMGRMAKGRVEVQQLFADEHATFMKGTTLTVTIQSERAVEQGLALVDCEALLAGVRSPEGQALPPFKHLIFALVKKQDGGWRFLAARLVVPVPPPPEN
jgi:uncharacterized protein (TIGR02246 family)